MANNVEQIKSESRGLRGTLVDSLQAPITGGLQDSDQVLIKYHGSYQQDDRDTREERRKAKLEPEYSFMIRTRTPGGVISPWQWLRLDKIAQDYASHGLRVTSRQALQFHGVVKTRLKTTMKAINSALIDTLAACGDVNRNVAVGLAPDRPHLQAAMYQDAAALSQRLLPSTRAYYEIWLDSEQIAGEVESDDIYGERYLPRKFKIGFALPPVNDIDVFTQDLGFSAIVENDQLLGYNVSVGGGMGASHNDPETFPRLADTIGFIRRAQLQDIAIAVLTTQRDYGNRAVRKRARLKYTIDDRGVAWFKSEVESRSGVQLQPARVLEFAHSADRFGWYENHPEEAGATLSLGLRIVAGRIADTAEHSGPQWQSALREIARLLNTDTPQHKPNLESYDARGLAHPHFLLTANQNVVLTGILASQQQQIEHILSAHGVHQGLPHAKLAAEPRPIVSTLANSILRDAMACVALPTCGLAMAEAERFLPEFSQQVWALWTTAGLTDTPLQLRISGCPNGCSRPYASEVALVGKAPGRYNLFLAGDHRGTRLNHMVRENTSVGDILLILQPLFQRYAEQRQPLERFGDFLVRSDALESLATGIHARERSTISSVLHADASAS